MKFGTFSIREAVDVILAHAVVTPTHRFKKSHRLTNDDVALLGAAGVTEIMGAYLEPSDIGEDEAAQRLATCVVGPNTKLTKAFTGRCNLIADTDGVLVIDETRVTQINNIDESLTLATLANHACVTKGQTIATAKIIPFACDERDLAKAEGFANNTDAIIRIHPFRRRSVSLISTLLPETKVSVVDKSANILDERLRRCGNRLAIHTQCEHTLSQLKSELEAALESDTQLILIFGASAITDRGDIIPSAIEAVGGVADHLGMPVDPGNLLLLGHKGNIPIIGLPGCARSPKLNGFDWVLERLLADIPVTPSDIKGMGVGGLLKEIPTRPQPREDMTERNQVSNIGAIILAAGQSRRMGRANKLLETVDGIPMVRVVANNLVAAGVPNILVVTGHEKDRVQAALSDLPLSFAHNTDFAAGLSTSLAVGVSEIQENTPDLDGVIVCLGDMPLVSADDLGSLKAAFTSEDGACIVVPTFNGKRGNPVIWSRDFFAEITELKGDVGARAVIGQYPESITEVDLGTDAIFLDVDTPEALKSLRDKN